MQLATDQLLSDLRLHNISADTLEKVILQIPISMSLVFFVGEAIKISRTAEDMCRLSQGGQFVTLYEISNEDELDALLYDLALALTDIGSKSISYIVTGNIEE